MVRIQGTSPETAYRFDIRLQYGTEATLDNDVAIRVSVRFLNGYISLNSLQNGIWGEEQRGAILPIKRGENFEVILMCDFTQYKVAINDQHYWEFPQRIHYDCITHLAIDGDASIIQISYESAFGSRLSSSLGNEMYSVKPISPAQNKTRFEMKDAAFAAFPPPEMRFEPPYRATTNLNQEWSGAPTMGTSPCFQPRAPGMPPPPPGPPVPIDPFASNNESEKRCGWQRCCAVFWGGIFSVFVTLAVVAKIGKKFDML